MFEQAEKVVGTVESYTGSLIHGVMDNVKNNFNTVTNSNASFGERALADVELGVEGIATAAAAYGLGKLGLSRVLGAKSLIGDTSATGRLLASGAKIPGAETPIATRIWLGSARDTELTSKAGIQGRIILSHDDGHPFFRHYNHDTEQQVHSFAPEGSMLPKVNGVVEQQTRLGTRDKLLANPNGIYGPGSSTELRFRYQDEHSLVLGTHVLESVDGKTGIFGNGSPVRISHTFNQDAEADTLKFEYPKPTTVKIGGRSFPSTERVEMTHDVDFSGYGYSGSQFKVVSTHGEHNFFRSAAEPV